MDLLNPAVALAIIIAVSIVAVMTIVSTVWYFDAIKKNTNAQGESIDLGRRSVDLAERTLQIQQETNELLREVLKRME